jgi:hypothetical protein
MKAVAKRTHPGALVLDDPFRASSPAFKAEAFTDIMLSTFEAELDSLAELIGADRRAASTEALLRRYMTAEEVYQDIEEGFRRIQLKMLMLSDKLAGDSSQGDNSGQ